MQPVMLVVGTRPEGIKMMPVYFALQRVLMPVLLCSTDQHSTLLQEVFDTFKVVPDIRLSLMKENQSLSYITQAVLEAMDKVYETYKPSLVLVQGDTTTVMAAALAAFYRKIPVGHVEAGLRTGDLHNPYPEELNRVVVGVVANYHFAPTAYSTGVLLAEGKKRESVFCVGNTVVDALQYIVHELAAQKLAVSEQIRTVVEEVRIARKKIILVTMHRRESFSGGIERVLRVIKNYAQDHPELLFLYPRHPNPAVKEAIEVSGIKEQKNIFITDPVAYHELVFLLAAADCVMTDSGGIQEEGVSLSKPVLVLREKSERMEGVWEGYAQLVGTQEEHIIRGLDDCLSKKKKEEASVAVYGDGRAAERIVRILQEVVFAKESTMHAQNALHNAMEKRIVL